MNKKDVIRLTDKMFGKGVIVTLWSDDLTRIETFKYLCKANLPKDLSWFHQANSYSHQMFELRKPQSAVLRCLIKRIAEEMHLEYEIDLSRPYNETRSVVMEEFECFYPEMHIFDDFW